MTGGIRIAVLARLDEQRWDWNIPNVNLGSLYGWPHAPHRTLRTRFVKEWVDRERETQDSLSDEPIIGHTVISGTEIPIQRFASMPPNIRATGDIESMSLLAGESVGLIEEIRPAAEILRETINGAERLIRELSAKVHGNGRTQLLAPFLVLELATI